MIRYVLPTLLLTACTTTSGEPVTSQARMIDRLVGQPLEWSHASGVGGRALHRADGTMTYDIRGEERTSRWSFSPDGTYCMNAGAPDADCYTLIETPEGFASGDGNVRFVAV